MREEIGPVFSPDGKHIAFIRQHGTGGASTLWLMRADGSEMRRLASNVSAAGQLDWSPSGDKVVYVGVAADAAARGDLFVLDTADGSRVQLTTTPARSESDPDWSPDGQEIAFAANPDLENTTDIWVVNAEGGEPRQLTTDPSNDDHPRWSPDSSLIAFRTARDAPCQTCEDDLGSNPYAINRDGSGERRLTDVDASKVEEMAWSGKRLYLSIGYDDESESGRNWDSEIYSVRADGTGFGNITDNRRADIDVSPSGGRIYFLRLASEKFRLTRFDLRTRTFKEFRSPVSDLGGVASR